MIFFKTTMISKIGKVKLPMIFLKLNLTNYEPLMPVGHNAKLAPLNNLMSMTHENLKGPSPPKK